MATRKKTKSRSSNRTKYSSQRKRYLQKRKKLLLTSNKKKAAFNEKLGKVFWTSLGFLSLIGIIGVVYGLFMVQEIIKELPPLDNPFPEDASSTIYDRSGTVELYKVSSEHMRRDLLRDDEYVPEALKWSFLAAEDEEFYEHGGVDFTALSRCLMYRIFTSRTCGGSTITQQVILNTVIRREGTIKRKIKDIIAALQLERLYTKDQIMNLYLNVVPQGSSVVGIKGGAKFYFKKELKDLTVAEMSVLSAVVQNPTILSPTVGSDIESNKARLDDRTDYIIDQMIENIDRINDRIEIANSQRPEDDENFPEQELLTVEMLKNAKEEVKALEYAKPTIEIKAPHFVFYVQKLLQERGYKNGEPFTEAEIRNGGYKIYTTLDYGIQEKAQEYVSSDEAGHAGYYRNTFGGHNSALLTLNPSNGEILAMVGSKCYQNNQWISNCDQLDEEEGKLFDSDVNILDTLQSPGSTNKAIGYYIAFNEGVISTSSVLPDVPINIRGWTPKNYNGAFSGKGPVSTVFPLSLNLPPIFLIETYGVAKYIDTAREFGYTTYRSADNYGPSVIIGGTDVKAIEHAQAFGVFANSGEYVQHEVIQKIVGVENGKEVVIYEHKPEKKTVADPAAIYLVNQLLNPNGISGSSAPPKHMLDRDVAGKTGTSENNRDTWFAMWSPEFVSVGWLGNNDNTPMSGSAFGSTSVEPWVGDYMESIAGSFPNKTAFPRPANVVYGNCSAEEGEECSSKGYSVSGHKIPQYLQKKKVTVCIDQPDRLARDIDVKMGFAVEKTFPYLMSPAKHLQDQVDKSLNKGIPTEECDIDRNIAGDKPDGIIFTPQPGMTYSNTIDINARAFVFAENSYVRKIEFKLDNKTIAEVDGNSYTNTLSLDDFRTGSYVFSMNIQDDKDNWVTKKVNIFVDNDNGNKKDSLSIAASTNQTIPNSPVEIYATYEGFRNIDTVELYETYSVTGITKFAGQMRKNSDNSFSYNWVGGYEGDYTLYAVINNERLTLTSNSVGINIEVFDENNKEGNAEVIDENANENDEETVSAETVVIEGDGTRVIDNTEMDSSNDTDGAEIMPVVEN